MKHVVKAVTDGRLSQREKEHYELVRKVASEGFVLLKNDGVLPLKVGQLALYGAGAQYTVSGGTGSGAMHQRYSVNVYDGIRNAGAEIMTDSWLKKYKTHYEQRVAERKEIIEKKTEGLTNPFEILGIADTTRFIYPTGVPVEDDDLTDCDTAVYIIARQAGEGNDRCREKGDYRLDDLEYKNLERIARHYRHTVVVINVGGIIDLSFLDEIDIGAVLFMAQGGMEGGNALADVLFGKANPSGKLTLSWAKKYEDYPNAEIYSEYGDPREQEYKEGIYVGYRYFDTFGVEPRYPFGYGLSYTTFCIKAHGEREKDGKISFAADVTNTGSVSGKEVVQVYVSVPRRGNQGAYQQLAVYQKTKLLSAGETQTLHMEFDLRSLAAYDEKESAYFLPQGTYTVRVGNSSRNTVPLVNYELQDAIRTEQCTPVCKEQTVEEYAFENPVISGAAEGVKTVVIRPNIAMRVHKYEELPVCADAKIAEKIEEMSVSDLATLVVGAGLHSDNLVTVLGSSGNTTSELYEKYGIPNLVLADGPAGLNVTPEVVVTETDDIKPMCIYPQYDIGALGRYMRSRIGKSSEGKVYYQYATALPVGITLAQTWNTDLMAEVGNLIAVEMMEFGVSVWLAPGVNIYRNPLCGRTFEYYSEDPLLAGTIAAGIINGVQRHKGCAVSLKHYACNNAEREREYSSSNVNEKALREIYLKAFEIAIALSHPKTIMASYNKINGVYATNNRDTLVNVLRNEWGFDGVVMSDWTAVDKGKGNPIEAMRAQCDLIMPGQRSICDELIAGIDSGELNMQDLKRCAARVLGLIEECKKI